MPDSLTWDNDWKVGVRVWMERAGRAILGEGRLELLEGIDRWHSISEAARRMRMSYRHAWLLVQDMNEGAGEPMVAAATGGKRGGGATLTARGRWAVDVFRDLREQVQRTAASVVPRMAQADGQPTVHIAAAVSLEEVLEQLLADYALWAPGVIVRTVFGASDELADLILAGAAADIFISADFEQIDRLAARRLVQRGKRCVIAENRLAAIAPKGANVMVCKPADLLGPQVSRIAMAAPSCPLGGYTRTYLQNLGLYDKLLAKAAHVNNSRSVAAAVRAGRAEAGLVYASDAGRTADCRLLFRAGRGTPSIRYAAAVVCRSEHTEEADRLVKFLASRPAARRFRRCGFLAPRVPRPKEQG
jgi:molybdate transport system substrate-binding protein